MNTVSAWAVSMWKMKVKRTVHLITDKYGLFQKLKLECEMTKRTCETCANYNAGVCTVDGFIMESYDAACDYYRAKRDGGGKADMGIRCPNCGGQIDFHAGHINNGRVFVCEKGKPLMREVKYHCRHCDSTVIFLKKCEPKEVNHG